MCTLTWRRETAGTFEVFFNRDEKKTRSVADPPARHEAGGVAFLSPRDPDGGGTWMLTNEKGLLVCLLNRWHEELPAEASPSTSRGRLVMDMGGLESVPAVEERLRSLTLGGVHPFTLVVFDFVGERGWDWNGRSLSPASLEPPVTSSSYRFEEVRTARRMRFRDLHASLAPGDDLLGRYHADTNEGASAFTTRMCRPDAQTMSRSRVRVGPGGVRWWYWEEQADLKGEPRLFEASL